VGIVARIIVTPELADTLRDIRLQNKIPAKMLAKHINKSPAYISKLESGNIQTLDNHDLHSILQFILHADNDPDVIAEAIYKSLKYKYTKKEIEEQLWFTNFDTVERKLPIPTSLVDAIINQLESLGVTREQLLSRINANEALTDEDNNDDTIPLNLWYHQSSIGGSAQSIKICMDSKFLDTLLSKEDDVSPYIFIFAIVFYILKISKFSNQVKISDDSNMELMAEATAMLNEHKFFSIAEKNALMSEKETQDEMYELLSAFDRDNMEIIGKIIAYFKIATEYNIKEANERLKKCSENMDWDLGFMIRIISLDYLTLRKISVSNKRKLIAEIERLVYEYSQLPENMNMIEAY
jgi:transcriptional regulator with XRE-family HTH domain